MKSSKMMQVIIFLLIAIAFFLYKNLDQSSSRLPITSDDTKCTRTTPYVKEPEFERALSLIKQRLNAGSSSWENCLRIEYADLSKFDAKNAEGIFYLDKSSSLNELKIYVNSSYKKQDDLLTAMLLVHELSHGGDYINFLESNAAIDCVNSEVNAYFRELVLVSHLTQEERNSINLRVQSYLSSGYQSGDELSKRTLDLPYQVFKIGIDANNQCLKKYTANSSDFYNCNDTTVKPMLENFVRENPFYQKQCNL